MKSQLVIDCDLERVGTRGREDSLIGNSQKSAACQHNFWTLIGSYQSNTILSIRQRKGAKIDIQTVIRIEERVTRNAMQGLPCLHNNENIKSTSSFFFALPAFPLQRWLSAAAPVLSLFLSFIRFHLERECILLHIFAFSFFCVFDHVFSLSLPLSSLPPPSALWP